jgi:type II secretory pathway component GspD/PulD (secretin)
MRVANTVVGAVLTLTLAAYAFAQETGAKSQKVVTMHIVIATHTGSEAELDLKSAEDVSARLDELLSSGTITSLTRATLTALDQRPAILQITDRVPVASSRVFRGGRGGEGGGGFGQLTYMEQATGTQVSATPQVQPDGSVIVEFQVEKSRLLPQTPSATAGGEAAAVEVPPPGMSTLSAQTTVGIAPGATVVVGGFQFAGDEPSSPAFILLSAEVAGGTSSTAQAAEELPKLIAFSLENASANLVAPVLAEVFAGRDLQIAVDERTNRLLVRAGEDDMHELEALLRLLDEVR